MSQGMRFYTFFWVVLLGLLGPVDLLSQPTWKRVFGGAGVEQVWAVEALSDGGFAVLGSTGSFGAASSDVYLFKLDVDGERVWSRLFGGPQIDEGRALVELPDGGLMIAGLTNSGAFGGYDGAIWRTNSSGDLLWERSFGGADWDMLYGIDMDLEGGVWVAGTTYSMGVGGDVWLLHLDGEGQVQFEGSFGSDREETGSSLRATDDGGCVITGAHVTDASDLDVLVMKFGNDGSLQWNGTYGGAEDDAARDIEVTIDGGYSVVGWTRSFNPIVEQYHIRLDPTGETIWQRNWGQVNDQEGFGHIQVPTGEFASIGYVSQGGAGGKDMFILKNTGNGDFILGQTQGGTQDDIGRAITRAEDGFVIAGITNSYGQGQWDIMVIRTDEVGFTASDLVISELDPVNVQSFTLTEPQISPNPSAGEFTLSSTSCPCDWQLFDQLGRQVDLGRLWSSSETIVTSVPDGSYILEVLMPLGVSRTSIVIAH